MRSLYLQVVFGVCVTGSIIHDGLSSGVLYSLDLFLARQVPAALITNMINQDIEESRSAKRQIKQSFHRSRKLTC